MLDYHSVASGEIGSAEGCDSVASVSVLNSRRCLIRLMLDIWFCVQKRPWVSGFFVNGDCKLGRLTEFEELFYLSSVLLLIA
jgi:hypothetical protein